jgi:fumarylacetoacetate (FAA) hydrolase
MKLASLNCGTADGQLVLVSRDLSVMVDASDIAPTMQYALEHWDSCVPFLQARYQQLNSDSLSNAQPFRSEQVLAPLPRSWQWLDGSCFLQHGHLMQQAFHLEPIADADKIPLVYQGAGDSFCGANASLFVAQAQHGADFEGEFGVITGDLPVGATPEQAFQAIRLVTLLNDISYRALAPREMKTGFGFVQAKGPTAFAPVAVTPDELGDAWHNARVCLPVHVHRNEQPFGQPDGAEMHFGFDQLISHVAVTRPIKAGSVFGSGTVSNANPNVGQACISELRAKEMIATGKPQTPFLSAGETVSIEVFAADGQSVFGQIRQSVTVGENLHV